MLSSSGDSVTCGAQAHMQGAPYLTKADLMSQADRSGLATRAGAIYGLSLNHTPLGPDPLNDDPSS